MRVCVHVCVCVCVRGCVRVVCVGVCEYEHVCKHQWEHEVGAYECLSKFVSKLRQKGGRYQEKIRAGVKCQKNCGRNNHDGQTKKTMKEEKKK